jgi:hypothetical protein
MKTEIAAVECVPASKRYNPPQREIEEIMKPARGLGRITMGMLWFAGLLASAAQAPGPWDQPAASLAEQIAAVLGPSQAHLTIRNNSSVTAEDIPAIRRLLEQELKFHGVQVSGVESANDIHVTLSENLHERLWVAEIIEGNETHVAMARVDAEPAVRQTPSSGLALRKQAILTIDEPVLAALEMSGTVAVAGPPVVVAPLVVVSSDDIILFSQGAIGWEPQKRVAIGQLKPLSRDPRAVVVPTLDGQGFELSAGAVACTGALQQADWTIHCRESDDPWPLIAPDLASTDRASASKLRLRAFYNSARNYFTGVVTPAVGIDLPPFYAAVLLPRADGAGLLLNGIDGKVEIAESGAIKAVTGTRDWGSDFAVLHSGCGTGSQIVASGAGQAITDSLRAYELPALEAIPVGDSLAMGGTVVSLSTSDDGKSVIAIIRKPAAPGHADPYEVDRVTATCN